MERKVEIRAYTFSTRQQPKLNGKDYFITAQNGEFVITKGRPVREIQEPKEKAAPEETTVTISEELYKTMSLVAETIDISVEELCLKILDKWANRK